jgi:hypothetical protein
MRPAATFFCALLCALLAACGYIGEPLYPALNIPARVADLVAVERGSRIDVDFSVPPLTTEGLEIRKIGAIELRAGAAPDGPFQPDRWAGAATRVDVPPPEHAGPVHASVPVEGFVNREIVVAARIANAKGRYSEWSNFVILKVLPVVPAPTGFAATPVAQGVQLSWNGAAPPSYRIFRRAPGQAQPAPLSTVDKPGYLDASAEFEKEYEYYVQAVNAPAESEIAGPLRVTPKDVFPPAVPAGLNALAGVNAVELSWDRNTEPDFKEYRIQRSVDGGPFAPLADGVVAPSYSDRAVASGKRYAYRILAVDRNGNQSEPSEPATVSLP